ncbi:MAG TPA: excisionase family DNA-binding protein [Sporichthyaceae bacterium]|jgi:excisionase family DNA binding protein|nr:excisionase family DNA-binding protein [Sporichthyaceae bacterium]
MSARLCTVEEAAERLNTTRRFVRRLIAERRIEFTELGRHVRIREDVLEAFLAAGTVPVVHRGIEHPGGAGAA